MISFSDDTVSKAEYRLGLLWATSLSSTKAVYVARYQMIPELTEQKVLWKVDHVYLAKPFALIACHVAYKPSAQAAFYPLLTSHINLAPLSPSSYPYIHL